ncbi:hypothetical protein TIFTF001_029437 [Ficus carica]|uniref:Uncharacterized protein n=1 Tax=Ficus carica TaxID=3494 RepID=A0AA88DSI9_FICCA|nr:hypothetical protein TIFTF001_029437 [Ficus carica]
MGIVGSRERLQEVDRIGGRCGNCSNSSELRNLTSTEIKAYLFQILGMITERVRAWKGKGKIMKVGADVGIWKLFFSFSLLCGLTVKRRERNKVAERVREMARRRCKAKVRSGEVCVFHLGVSEKRRDGEVGKQGSEGEQGWVSFGKANIAIQNILGGSKEVIVQFEEQLSFISSCMMITSNMLLIHNTQVEANFGSENVDISSQQLNIKQNDLDIDIQVTTATSTSAQSGAIKLGHDLKSKHRFYPSDANSTISRSTHDGFHNKTSPTQSKHQATIT